MTSEFPSKRARLDWRQVALPSALLLPLCILIFARIMNFELRRDEQLYVPPVALMRQYDLYADIFYNHVPGSAWLFSIVAAVLNTDHLLFASRLAVFGGWVLLGTGVMLITLLLTRSLAVTFAMTIFVMLNDALVNQTGMAATNNLLPLPFAYAGMGLFLLGVTGERVRPVLIAAGGLALGLAASIKVNAVGFILPIAVAAFLLPAFLPFGSRIRSVVIPLALGGIVGASPVLFYLATDGERFLAHIVGFHVGPHVAYWSAQAGTDPVAISLMEKSEVAYRAWTGTANLFLIYGIVFIVLQLIAERSSSGRMTKLFAGPVLLAAAALIISGGMSFIPTPGFPQYFAPPLIAAALLATCLYAQLDAAQRREAAFALASAALLVVVLNVPHLAPSAKNLMAVSKWTPSKVHQGGLAIARRLHDAGLEGKVATLAPLYPLEGGLAVYPELGTGEFAYRAGDLMDPTLRRHFPIASPASIGALLAADPPAALLLGFSKDLEGPLVEFARANGYVLADELGIKDRYGTPELYLRRPATSP